MKPKALLAGLLLLLAACSCPPKVDDYAGREPAMDIREYLKGNVEAWGVIQNRAGMVTDQFHVTLKGTWKGNDGTLEEHFLYTDGRKDARVWSIHFSDDHHCTATAHDVIGEAKGAQFGNAVNMAYILHVPVKDTTYDLSMDDWMYLMDKHTDLNHTTMHKFGIKVGELFLTFKKP